MDQFDVSPDSFRSAILNSYDTDYASNRPGWASPASASTLPFFLPGLTTPRSTRAGSPSP